MTDLFPSDPGAIDWRRRAEREAQDAEHLRSLLRPAESALLSLLALITMDGGIDWSPDIPTTPDSPVGHAVHRAGEVLEALQATLGEASRG